MDRFWEGDVRALAPAAPPRVDRRNVALASAIFLFFCGFASVGYFLYERVGNDFTVFWTVANRPAALAYNWGSDVYGFPYAPTMLIWIQPLRLVPLAMGFVLFNLLGIALFVYTVRRHLPWGAVGLCLISPALFSGVMTGQVSLILCSIVLAACATPNRLLAGLMFGIVASVKPQLVLMAPLFFILTRDWRAFVAAGATFAAVVAASLLLFGTERWIDWYQSLGAFHHVVAKSNIIKLGVTPGIVAERWHLPRIGGMAIGAAIGILTLVFGRRRTAVEQTALIGTASLMAAPYALGYDLIMFVPLIALTIWRGSFLPVMTAFPLYPLPLLASCRELLRKQPPDDPTPATR
ncbi:glycosyltransferase family 87 protein [Sphingomonas jaspsi]|uniref:glycosyltransferase family 87 protein n=1 Tax=Sphingomonas jaspsi TaxID=392409 RepID=UPI000561842B|nr:glycosyltransferase family 87 protein [Sphingomonas jaspsi]